LFRAWNHVGSLTVAYPFAFVVVFPLYTLVSWFDSTEACCRYLCAGSRGSSMRKFFAEANRVPLTCRSLVTVTAPSSHAAQLFGSRRNAPNPLGAYPPIPIPCPAWNPTTPNPQHPGLKFSPRTPPA